ncbi:MAG: acetyl-CoA C-acetyltransferase [Acidobacteriota bacterium]
MSREIWILEGARTPMCRYVGQFSEVSAIELGAVAARAALERAGVAAEEVDHVIIGNAQQTSPDAVYGARHVGLRAGIGEEVPALTVNRLCGSGIQSIIEAAYLFGGGEAEVVVAGGMENMTQAPHVVYGARKGFRLGGGKLEDSLTLALLDSYCGCTMSQTSDNLATKYGISREEQDRFALRSQQLASKAQESGVLAEEIVPVEVKARGGSREVSEDDHLRPETTLEGLAGLPAAFGEGSSVTAGNASGIVDGAAATIVVDGEWGRERQLQPLGRVVSWGVAGVDPTTMGIGPVPASRQALQRAGWELDKVDLVEVNEAFAGQYLAVEQELGLDRDRVNVNGGAIALGHPLGATGTRLVLTLLKELARRGGGRGLATACIGGGQGIAICVETI